MVIGINIRSLRCFVFLLSFCCVFSSSIYCSGNDLIVSRWCICLRECTCDPLWVSPTSWNQGPWGLDCDGHLKSNSRGFWWRLVGETHRGSHVHSLFMEMVIIQLLSFIATLVMIDWAFIEKVDDIQTQTENKQNHKCSLPSYHQIKYAVPGLKPTGSRLQTWADELHTHRYSKYKLHNKSITISHSSPTATISS